ncbi:MAG: hypothetical protein GF353_18955 [Candidatus Lokiarchaeota archaeon]|nr:hypothetical protein [Candidatus Lokiarchaeota archaeon]
MLEQNTEFLECYESYVQEVIEPTYEELKEIFRKWNDPKFWKKYSQKEQVPIPSPIRRTNQRIKRPESVVDKIFRKPQDYPDGLTCASLKNMHDLLGGRISVFFNGDLPLIDLELRKSSLFEVSEERSKAYFNKDHLNKLGLNHVSQVDKDSGYTSIHYIVRLKESVLPEEKRPWFEIQVRTLIQDAWADIEHVLGYKPNKSTILSVRKQFQLIASQLCVIDEHFDFLRHELSKYQEKVTFNPDDDLNAENLPLILNKIGIECAQREINGLLKLLNSRGISKAGDLTNQATNMKLDVINNTFVNYIGREPNNFEKVASIAAIKDMQNEQQMNKTIKAQIDFLSAWEKLKKNF